MESPKTIETVTLNDSDSKPPAPILIRLGDGHCSTNDIHIDKNEFRIGRARDNDEIILDVMISRRHCIIRCEGNEEWTIKDLSSSATFINNVPLVSGKKRRLTDGDIIQFSICEKFRYKFTIAVKEEHRIKRPRLDVQILDNVLTEQKTFAKSQEAQKRVLKEKLQIKQKEQDMLKQQLEELFSQQSVAKEDNDELKKQIVVLEGKIENGKDQEQHLHKMYADFLEKLENERVQFEKRLNDEKQKWQEALNVSKQEKEALEIKTREQMVRFREEQQAEWKSVMENRVKEEKSIQAQLLNEKIVLEEKLKETEKALKEKEATAVTAQNNAAGPSETMDDSCIFLEFIDDPTGFQILDTIDLTVSTPTMSNTQQEKDSVIDKVSNIMDEQLTCSVCSELFVKATTLNCMHTFCQHCIAAWSKKRKDCPVCRAPVASMNRSIVLDNFIESMLENLPTHFKERRKELIDEREVLASIHKRKVR